MSLQSFKVSALITTLFCGGAAMAQQIDPGGALLRNIQESQLPMPVPAEPFVGGVQEPGDALPFVSNLSAVDISDSAFKEGFEQYWKPFFGKAVTNADVQVFKDKAWQDFLQGGYLGLVAVSADSAGTLIIRTEFPVVGTKSFTGPQELQTQYMARIEGALLHVQEGQPIDLVDIEQRLYNMSYDLPIEVGVVLSPQADSTADLIFDISPKDHTRGRFKGGLVQVNNYGLTQFGRYQILGSFGFEGFTPGSMLSLVTQASEGMIFGRAEYSAPIETLRGVGRVWIEGVTSKNIDRDAFVPTRGVTVMYGIGLSNILGSRRSMVFQSGLDFSQRHTKNSLQNGGLVLGNITDNQAKFRLSASNSLLAKDNIVNYELTAVLGSLSDTGIVNELNGNLNDGSYAYITGGASILKNITSDGWYFIGRARGQALASRNLDAYNRISLGGINGVRAYSTADGVGDMGAMGSLEVRKAYNGYGDYVGVFYDGGIVRPNRNALPGISNSTYALQAIGVSMAGNIRLTGNNNYAINYNLSVAKAIGSNTAYQEGSYETRPNSWRVNFAVTFPL